MKHSVLFISLSALSLFSGCNDKKLPVKPDSKLEQAIEETAEELIDEAFGVGVKIDLSPEEDNE